MKCFVKIILVLISEREYEKVKNQFEVQFIQSNTRIEGIANSLARAHMLYGNINAVNDEILIRKKVEELLENFKGDEQEGLIALLVGSNRLTTGSRTSVGVAQNAAQGQLIAAFDAEVIDFHWRSIQFPLSLQ